MNLMVKKYENWSRFVEVIVRQSWPGTFDTPSTSVYCGGRRVYKRRLVVYVH